jgi:hypothetical protein
MPENDKQPNQRDDVREEYRSLAATIAAVTIPAATVAKPVATEWAKQKFSQERKDAAAPPPQQRQQKTD